MAPRRGEPKGCGTSFVADARLHLECYQRDFANGWMVCLNGVRWRCYDDGMVTTREQALEIAAKVRAGLERIYAERLRGVYLYGSAARDELTSESDIDIAVVLDKIEDSFCEHERASQLGSDLSLEYNTLVSFLFAADADFQGGRFAIHRIIRKEGIAA